MTGLAKPYAGDHPITQGFVGHNIAEPVGYLAPDQIWAQKAYKSGWTKFNHLHMAQDVAMPIGTDLLAPCAGKIVHQGTYDSTGEHYLMLLIHKDAALQTIVFYTHIKDGGLLLPAGTHVKAGQHIAESGNSGMSSGPHLHWEVRVGAVTADSRLSSAWKKAAPGQCMTGGQLASQAFLVPNV